MLEAFRTNEPALFADARTAENAEAPNVESSTGAMSDVFESRDSELQQAYIRTDILHVRETQAPLVQVRHRDTATGRGIGREAVEGSARPLRVEREIVMARKAAPRGTGDVLADLGFPDAEELSAKTVLAVKLNALIDARGLSQVEAARITGMTQPKVSQVSRYKLQNISLERLMLALVSLDQHVEIVVRPARRAQVAGITVAG